MATLLVEALLERKKDIDHIIIETTGLADPGRVAGCFWLDSELESKVSFFYELETFLSYLEMPLFSNKFLSLFLFILI